MDAFAVAVGVLGLIAGGLTISSGVYELITSRIQASSALSEAREAEFETALTSNDLVVLGDYLYDRIGVFTLHDYGSDPRVRARVVRFVEQIKDYIGAPPLKLPDEPPLPEEESRPEAAWEHIEDAADDIRAGNLWNGLAKLRLAIELQVRDVAMKQDVPYDGVTFRRLVRELQRRGLIVPQATEHLVYTYTLASRGVHGVDVSTEEAELALEHADAGLRLLSQGNGSTH